MARAICWLLFAGCAPAQSGGSSLSGTVSGPDGGTVADAPIQLRNKATGALARTASKSDGRYALAGLAAGSYELSLVMQCCAYQRFTRDVRLDTGQAVQLDIRLAETVNGTTLGDDPGRLATVMVKRAKVPARPTPRTSSGKPDLSGVWIIHTDPYPEQPEALPWAAALIEERRQNNAKDAPHNHCLPGPPPLPQSTAPFMTKFVQTPVLLVVLIEDNPGFRQVFLDGRGHSANWEPSWMGHSVGRWEKDALVVDTVGFNDRVWIGAVGGGGFPHTEMLRMTERYRRLDFGHMEAAVTYEDPGAYVKPFHMNLKLDLAPQEEVLEYVCENNKPEHLVGK